MTESIGAGGEHCEGPQAEIGPDGSVAMAARHHVLQDGQDYPPNIRFMIRPTSAETTCYPHQHCGSITRTLQIGHDLQARAFEPPAGFSRARIATQYGLEAVSTAPTAPAAARPTPSVVLSIVAVGAAAVREVHNFLLHNWLGPFGHFDGLRPFGRPGAW